MAWLDRLARSWRLLLGPSKGAAPGRRTRLGVEGLEGRLVPAMPALPANLGTPTAWGALPGPPSTYAVQVKGDFNGDGLTDVAGLTGQGTWYVGLSHRDGFWVTPWVGGWPEADYWVSFEVGDFNGDGRQDIAALGIDGTWLVALSTGHSFITASWGAGWRSRYAWRTTVVADFNGDGRDDIAALDTGGRWWIGLAAGNQFQITAAAATWPAGVGWEAFAVGHFRGGRTEQVAALHPNGQWWLLSDLDRHVDTSVWLGPWSVGKAPATVQVGDFDGDGNDDLAAFYDPGEWFEFRSTGSAFQVLHLATGWSPPGDWLSFQTGDFDGDGKDEIAAVLSDGEIWLLQPQAVGSSSVRWSLPVLPDAPSYSLLGSGDVNGDSRPDLLFRDSSGVFFVALSTGSSFVFGAPTASFYLIAPWDLQKVDNPTTFVDLFQRYKGLIRTALGPAFSRLNDAGVGFVLATEIAYEHASYRGFHDPDGTFPTPRPFKVRSLLAVPKLVCNEYCYLTYYLFRTWRPWIGPDDPVHIAMVGWAGSPFGNHAQLAVSGTGLPLLLDPTTGLIAITTLAGLRSGVAVPGFRVADLSVRVEHSAYMEASTSLGRQNVYNALREGLYPLCTFLYNVALDSTFYHGARARPTNPSA